jgi:hypothetical protein
VRLSRPSHRDGRSVGEEPTGPVDEALSGQIMNEYWAYEKAVTDAGVKVASDALRTPGPRPRYG